MTVAPFPFELIGEQPAPSRRKMLVDGLIAEGDVVAIAGEPGVGKSFIGGHLVLSIGTRRNFFGRGVERGAVLYVAGERPAVTKRRLEATVLKLELGKPPIAVVRVAPFLGKRNDAERIIATAGQLAVATGEAVKLIVIDTLARSIPGLDEDRSKDMGVVMTELSRIAAETGAAIVVVHHTTHGTEKLRGSTAILGAVDAVLIVKGHGKVRTVRVAKLADGEEGATFAFRLARATIAGEEFAIVEEVVERAEQPAATGRLAPDVRTALETLRRLDGTGEPVPIDEWRDATLAAFGDRKQAYKRQAWSKATRLLADRGLIVTSGSTVSVSDPSAKRQH